MEELPSTSVEMTTADEQSSEETTSGEEGSEAEESEEQQPRGMVRWEPGTLSHQGIHRGHDGHGSQTLATCMVVISQRVGHP